ncbi:MAG: hypothetical protein ACRCVT_13810 [Leadbetterella sp.]
MKKIIVSAAFLACVISFPACDSGSGVDPCTEIGLKMQSAASAYGEKQNKENCNAWLDIMNEFINSACFVNYETQLVRDDIVNARNTIDCSIYK